MSEDDDRTDAVLRLRRSAEEGRCCCCRNHPEDEPECDDCDAVLMVDDPDGPLCKDCCDERGTK